MKFSVRNYARIAEAALTRRVPVYAHWGITHRCNLTCKMCGIWRYGNEKEELNLDQVKLMAERMARLGVVQLSIGGGEPFASPIIEDAAKAFVDQGLNTRVLTNGIGEGNGRNVVAGRRYLDRVDRCIDNGVRNFSISLDSLYPARFDFICEVDGAWNEAVKTNRSAHDNDLPYFCLIGHSRRRDLSKLALSGQELWGANRSMPVPAPPRPSLVRYVPAACHAIRIKNGP